MKKLFSFVRIDFVRTRSFWWILFLPFVTESIVMFRHTDGGNLAFGIGYSMFLGMILATMPFKTEEGGEQGFFRMLPVKPGEQVTAHFLFAAIVLVVTTLMGFLGALLPTVLSGTPAAVGRMILRELPASVFAVFFGGAFLFLGIEGVICVGFRFQNARAAAFARLVPALAFFFVMMSLSEQESEMDAWQLAAASFLRISRVSLAIGLAGVLAFAALAFLSGRLAAAREMGKVDNSTKKDRSPK